MTQARIHGVVGLVLGAVAVCALGGCPATSSNEGAVAGASTAGIIGTGIQVTGTDADGDGVVDSADADGGAGFGSLLLDAPADAVHTSFDIFDAASGRLITRASAARTAVYLAPGAYRLTRYFTSSFIYADNLDVRASETTSVALGALRVVTVPETADGEFDLYDETGVKRYSAANDVNVPIAAPPGTYLLTQYFNRGFVYAAAVTVAAGQTIDVRWLFTGVLSAYGGPAPLGYFQYTGDPLPAEDFAAEGKDLLFWSPGLGADHGIGAAVCRRWPSATLYELRDPSGLGRAHAAVLGAAPWTPAGPSSRWRRVPCASA